MTATGTAFARANLIGEHTDYNQGFVLPTPLPFKTLVHIDRHMDKDSIIMESDAVEGVREFPLDFQAEGNWTDYVLSCLYVLRKRKVDIPPLKIRIQSTIPIGTGVSSSAALLVATLRALRTFLDLPINDKEIALMAHEAEREFVGVPCGIMDQFVCSLGHPGHALMLDTLTLSYEQIPLPSGFHVALVNCGKKHSLAGGTGYRQRVEECRSACAQLGVQSLREITIHDMERIEALPEPLRKRARHVVTENQRVLDSFDALRKKDVERLSKFMAASHDSQRDDYQVSIPEIDLLVDSSRRFGVFSARLTGGGFGGSIVALVPEKEMQAWWLALKKENPDSSLIFERKQTG